MMLSCSTCQSTQLGMDKTTYFLSLSRLAPVQATWWGNADTSGVPAIDYFLTSEYEHPGADERYTEEVFQLKYVCITGGSCAQNGELTVVASPMTVVQGNGDLPQPD